MRPPKKSATLEVRLPQETKDALMAKCEVEQQSASDVVRAGIEAFLAGPAATRECAMQKPHAPWAVAALLGATTIFALMASPSPAAPDLRAAFARLDANGDGIVDRAEFEAAHRREQIVVGYAGSVAMADAPTQGTALRPGAMTRATRVVPPVAPIPSAPATLARTDVLPEIERVLLGEEFARIDGDDDGRVSLQEYLVAREATIRAAFAASDTNSDGWLTADEVSVAEAGQDGNLRPLTPQEFIARYDRDKDQRLNYDKFSDL